VINRLNAFMGLGILLLSSLTSYATNARIKTTVQIRKDFKLVDDLKVSYNTHLGWKVGPQASVPLADQSGQEIMTAENHFPIPDDCWVVNASAGVAV
jgi:hypothetical protein